MNSRPYEYILAIAECQNLTEAARQLHISQPALSKFLAMQEEEAGTPLFISYHRKLIPTPAGQIYIRSAKEFLRVKNITYRQIQNYIENSTRQLTVGASGYSGSIQISPVIADMFEQFPNISIRIQEGASGTLLRLLSDGKIDFAILAFPAEQDIPFTFYQFYEMELCMVVPVSFKASLFSTNDDTPLVDLAEFQHTPFILPDSDISYQPYLLTFFAEVGFSPIVIYTSSNPFVVKTLVEKGQGVSFLPDHFISQLDWEKCSVFRLRKPPLLRAGLAVRKDLYVADEETYFINRFLEHEQKHYVQHFYPNEETMKILNTRMTDI